ncbi:MAG TPA: hypothetical protein PLF30_04330 [Candidatus Moranbacteria bacterium]|jgi:hypothetical protein|nr:hypothetical protein [Candidatus Moranbacteria bacterium]HPX94753.1 hypothetical protein [Candidatus Moranbacteria bacterium]HQB59932.1 hypothetical protein [Candidatus Moranbacteria bacterium]
MWHKSICGGRKNANLNKAANNPGLFKDRHGNFMSRPVVFENQPKSSDCVKKNGRYIVLVKDENGHVRKGDHQDERYYTLHTKGNTFIYVSKKWLSLKRMSHEVNNAVRKKKLTKINSAHVRR